MLTNVTGIFYHPSFSRRSYLTQGSRLRHFPGVLEPCSAIPVSACSNPPWFPKISSSGSTRPSSSGRSTGTPCARRPPVRGRSGPGGRNRRPGRDPKRLRLHRSRRASFRSNLLRGLLLLQRRRFGRSTPPGPPSTSPFRDPGHRCPSRRRHAPTRGGGPRRPSCLCLPRYLRIPGRNQSGRLRSQSLRRFSNRELHSMWISSMPTPPFRPSSPGFAGSTGPHLCISASTPTGAITETWG